MSLTFSTHSLPAYRDKTLDKDLPFQHQPSYITLSRTLTRLSASILPLSPSTNTPPADLTPQQQQTLQDLLSPLPYHRTKTFHTIEHARTLLLQLEQSAQNVKIQRVKKDAVRDLADKRKVIRRLRAVVEELGREAERRERENASEGGRGDYEQGETVEELMGLPPLEEDNRREERRDRKITINDEREGQDPETERPATNIHLQHSTNTRVTPPPSISPQQQKQELFNLRNRRPNTTTNPSNPNPNPNLSNPPPTTGTTTALSSSSSLLTTETPLQSDHLTQTTLTSSLLTLAQQLKTQSLAFSTHLQTTDAPLLDRALAGLDSNVGGLEAASKKMGLLRRMSEGEGWWGRIMLYLWIWALWALAVGLVFLGPKLRF